ncbi:sensor histidine kinase [Flavobacterium celericrescens]|uniref:histidine kinase n=1 Tax=Flavobacterium celericrescens TaxID=2709780 RepID=A0ABX0IAF1_9FLAO|nr:ATP-binding protein [Flavobacterium celericrescens]NHM04101.1 cell wall metabolism sensor histidine kinase WalK [Flavobacterium celericrescens]
MRIKTKLNLGVGLLFLLIIILSLLSAFYIHSIKKDTQNILKANYETLEYSRNMLLALDAINKDKPQAVAMFEVNLNKQLRNITEFGEDNATYELRDNFRFLKANSLSDSIVSQMHQNIFEIMKLNMDAIKQKSDVAKKTAETANFWVILIGVFCFLIAFNLLVSLPNNIANPIKELTSSIQEIANKNYSERVHFLDHNEFGDLARSFNTMAQKLEEYHSSNLYKLSFEKKRLETLINNMHDPIIGLDNQDMILFVNDEALKIIGLKQEEVIGKSAVHLALENDLIRTLLVNTTSFQKALPIKIFADGRESYFEKERVNITITPTGEDKTITIGHVIILRNITIFKELDFAKTNFIATVSHELKTPISAIKLSLQLLENKETGTINEEQKQLIESIKEDSQRLLKITGELLDISQLETGNIHLSIEKSNPYQIVEYAVDAVKVQTEQKLISIHIDAEANLPMVKADAEKTGWVLINFLTNAITYSPIQSKIIVKLKADNEQVIFQVQDYGKGIDKRYQSKVFDKYFQIPGSNKSGTGLGLAISKEFIEAQNGTIAVTSELGLGSTFSIGLNSV